MAHNIKIHLFKTSGESPARMIFERLFNADFAERNQEINGDTFRMEDLKAEDGSQLLLMNFIRLRLDEGPGKAGLNQKVTGFGLARSEGFAEETAVLYDPETELWVIQYNHFGPRAGAVASYMSRMQHPRPSMDLVPVWRDDAMRELACRPFKTKLEIKVAARSISALDADGAVGLTEGLKAARANGADTLTLEIGVRRGNSFSGKVIDSWMGWFHNIKRKSAASSLDRFVVTAKGPGFESKEINLLNFREEKEFPMKAGKDRRLPLEARWDTLVRAWEEWKLVH